MFKKANLRLSDNVTTGGVNGFREKKQIRVILIVAIFIFVIIAGAYLIIENNEKNKKKLAGLCSSGDTSYVYQTASGIMSSSTENNAKLKIVVDEINQISGYDNSPDCLNIIVRYYLNEGNAEMARAYFDKLTIAYAENGQKKLTLVEGDVENRTYEQLKSQVEFLESNVSILKDNSSKDPWNNDPSLKEE